MRNRDFLFFLFLTLLILGWSTYAIKMEYKAGYAAGRLSMISESDEALDSSCYSKTGKC